MPVDPILSQMQAINNQSYGAQEGSSNDPRYIWEPFPPGPAPNRRRVGEYKFDSNRSILPNFMSIGNYQPSMSPESLISGGFMGHGTTWNPPTTGGAGYFQAPLPTDMGNFIDSTIRPGDPLYNPLYPTSPAPSPIDLIRALQGT